MSAISSYLAQKNVENLYHFTEVRNLKYIFDYQALLSIMQIRNLQVPTKTGGDERSLSLAEHWGITDYISLSFTPYTPMSSYRKLDRHLCFLVFKLDAVELPNVLFCDGNANRTGTKRLPGLKGAQNINLSAIKNGVSPGSGVWHAAARSEILIPQRLPLEYLDRIVFVNPISLEQGQDVCPNPEEFNFIVDKDMFLADPSVEHNIGFNILTSIEFENCYFNGKEYIIDRTQNDDIVLKIEVQAVSKMRLVVNTVCKSFSSAWEGTYMGTFEATYTYPIGSFVNQQYLFNFWLDGSFWRRKVMVIN